MSAPPQPPQDPPESVEKRTPEQQDEAISVASTWAQEKIENFLTEVESQADDHKSVKISHITSRKISIDVLDTNANDDGKSVKSLIEKLVNGNTKEALHGSGEHVYSKLLRGPPCSAQTEKNSYVPPAPPFRLLSCIVNKRSLLCMSPAMANISPNHYSEVTFDSLGGLNRLDTFYCYRFAASGLAVIGTCVVRSAAVMIDGNTCRVILNSSENLDEAKRARVEARIAAMDNAQDLPTQDVTGELVVPADGVVLVPVPMVDGVEEDR
ncbi:hypothetical protein DL98DRAFT_596305 [Cadophora sp. DSE1049]|nr:hypothetical protein DL98DRAFT_596305 [Cadophora sp. DSE1049]